MQQYDRSIIDKFIASREPERSLADFVLGLESNFTKTGNKLRKSKWRLVNIWRKLTKTEKFDVIGFYTYNLPYAEEV